MGILKVGIAGAGIVGLTSALELQNILPSADITVIANEFNQDTTSDGAAGLFRPGTSFCGPSIDITRKWIEDAYRHYSDLIPERCGIKEVGGYIFSSISQSNVQNHYLEKLVPVYRPATRSELKLCPGDWKYGAYFSTLLIECRQFLPWAVSRFKKGGGKVEKGNISSFDDLFQTYDVVFNCTGLGAKLLCNDYKLVPIRGQVLKVSAPWLNNFFYGDFDTYIIPGFNGVATLGGCRQFDSFSTDINHYDRAAILERCHSLVPRLKNAPITREWVGLRPHRDPVRVEIEVKGKNKIVHNYGHGGYGVTAAAGTSKHAVRLLIQSLSSSSASCKL
ncbi:D-amino acid oxidase 1 isoform X2 [Lycorma delicatula]